MTGSVILFFDYLCLYLLYIISTHVQTSGGRQESSCQTVGDPAPAPATTQSDKGAGLKVDKYSCMQIVAGIWIINYEGS